MKIFWKPKFLETAESDIICVKWGLDHDTALWLVLAEIWAFLYPKTAPQNVLQNTNFKAPFGRPLRANGNCDVIETHLQ